MQHRIVLGSRGSELALTQARMVENALRKAWPELEIAIEVIHTSGDERGQQTAHIDPKAGRKGMFTREIERELRSGRIDIAVHSAKDLPSETVDDLELAATLPRANTDDVLVTKEGLGLTSIVPGATIATGSIRRQRQLNWKRPDLKIVDLRGNVPTRLRKLAEHPDWSGIILARAGLERLGIVESEGLIPAGETQLQAKSSGEGQGSRFRFGPLRAEDFLAAGGQGIIALQIRRGDEGAKRLMPAIDHPATHHCLRAEREFLRLLQGDCDSPVGVQARLTPNELTLRAQVFTTQEIAPRVAVVRGRHDDPTTIALRVLEQIYGR